VVADRGLYADPVDRRALHPLRPFRRHPVVAALLRGRRSGLPHFWLPRVSRDPRRPDGSPVRVPERAHRPPVMGAASGRKRARRREIRMTFGRTGASITAKLRRRRRGGSVQPRKGTSMKKLIALGLALGTGLILAGTAQAQVKFGVTGPFTGPNAAFGAQIK